MRRIFSARQQHRSYYACAKVLGTGSKVEMAKICARHSNFVAYSEQKRVTWCLSGDGSFSQVLTVLLVKLFLSFLLLSDVALQSFFTSVRKRLYLACELVCEKAMQQCPGPGAILGLVNNTNQT